MFKQNLEKHFESFEKLKLPIYLEDFKALYLIILNCCCFCVLSMLILHVFMSLLKKRFQWDYLFKAKDSILKIKQDFTTLERYYCSYHFISHLNDPQANSRNAWLQIIYQDRGLAGVSLANAVCCWMRLCRCKSSAWFNPVIFCRSPQLSAPLLCLTQWSHWSEWGGWVLSLHSSLGLNIA